MAQNCTVREAITSVLQIKKSTNFKEIASVSGLKQIEVLKIITANRRFLTIDDKGLITVLDVAKYVRDQIVKKALNQTNEDFQDGKVYKLDEEYYTKYLNLHGNEELHAKLDIDMHGYNLHFKGIPNTPAHIAELEKAGLIEYNAQWNKLIETNPFNFTDAWVE